MPFLNYHSSSCLHNVLTSYKWLFSFQLQDWTQSFMSKVSSRELLTPSVELSLLAETRFSSQPSLYIELASRIHDIIGDDESSTVSSNIVSVLNEIKANLKSLCSLQYKQLKTSTSSWLKACFITFQGN